MALKCRKCRHVLLVSHEVPLFTAHGEYIDVQKNTDECTTLQSSSVFYMQDDHLPPWIAAAVDEEGWMKGRLHCPKCQGRVGGFDFVSGQKCACGQHVLPSVHLVKSKVDKDLEL